MACARSYETPFNELESAVLAALAIVGGRWSSAIVTTLSSGPQRHSDLAAALPGVSRKVLTESLRRLERDGLVRREHYQHRPVRSRYSLTGLGVEATGLLETIERWANEHHDRIEAARTEYDTTRRHRPAGT